MYAYFGIFAELCVQACIVRMENVAFSPEGVLMTWYTRQVLVRSNRVTLLRVCPRLVFARRHARISRAMC